MRVSSARESLGNGGQGAIWGSVSTGLEFWGRPWPFRLVGIAPEFGSAGPSGWGWAIVGGGEAGPAVGSTFDAAPGGGVGARLGTGISGGGPGRAGTAAGGSTEAETWASRSRPDGALGSNDSRNAIYARVAGRMRAVFAAGLTRQLGVRRRAKMNRGDIP